MCPVSAKMMCPTGGETEMLICFGVKLFLLVWVIFVPVVITARLEKIIKLLQERNKS